jgi:hypothetical protein
MVDLKRKVIRLQGNSWPITSFGVFWACEPHGLFATLEEVTASLGEGNFEHAALRPVSVALTGTAGIYEVIG